MKKILSVLMLLMIAATGIAAGTDYAMQEAALKYAIEEIDNNIYKMDVDISSDAVRIDYCTDANSAEMLFLDMAAVLGVYSGMTKFYPEIGDLMAKFRDSDGGLVGTYYCEREWAENVASDDDAAIKTAITNVSETLIFN